MAISTILILLLHKCGESFHFPVFFSVSFFGDWKLLPWRSFTSLVRLFQVSINTLLENHNSLLYSNTYPCITDEWSYQPFPKKLLCIANGNHHRTPQLDTRQISRDNLEPRHNRCIYITALGSMV